MAIVPDSQLDVLSKRVKGIQAEYEVRRLSTDNNFQLKSIDGQLSIDLTEAKASADVELNLLKQAVQRGIAALEVDTKLELAALKGTQDVALAHLGADLGIERSVIIGEAELAGKIDVAQQRAVKRLELAAIDGVFKQDMAHLSGGFQVEVAKLEAENTLAVSDVRKQGILASGALDVLGIQRESVLKRELIGQRTLTDVTLQAIADDTQSVSITQSGHTDDSITFLNANLDATVIADNAELSTSFVSQETLADVQMMQADSALSIALLQSKTQNDIALLGTQSAVSREVDLTLARQESLYTTIESGLRIEAQHNATNSELSGVEAESLLKAGHISTMKLINQQSRITEAAIDTNAMLQEDAVRNASAEAILNARIVGEGLKTAQRADHIRAREIAKAGLDAALITAEGNAAKIAAGVQAGVIAQSTLGRVNELNTMSLADYNAAILAAKQRALATKSLAEQDGQNAIDTAKIEILTAEGVYDSIRDIQAFENTVRWIADRNIALLNKNTVTHRYVNTIAGESQSTGPTSQGSPPGSTIINPPKLLEVP